MMQIGEEESGERERKNIQPLDFILKGQKSIRAALLMKHNMSEPVLKLKVEL